MINIKDEIENELPKKVNLRKENLKIFLKDDDNTILVNLVNHNFQTLLQWFNILTVFKIIS